MKQLDGIVREGILDQFQVIPISEFRLPVLAGNSVGDKRTDRSPLEKSKRLVFLIQAVINPCGLPDDLPVPLFVLPPQLQEFQVAAQRFGILVRHQHHVSRFEDEFAIQGRK
jgi:hypothetical protein